MTVLLDDGQTGQSFSTVGAARALALAGHEVHVAHADPLTLSARSRFCSRRVRVRSVDDAAGHAADLERLAAGGRYELVLVSCDAALVALGWPGAELVDKEEVARRAPRAGFAPVRQRTYPDGAALVADGDALTYPLVVKPVLKIPYRSSVHGGYERTNGWRAQTPGDLAPAAGVPLPLLVQEWLPGRTHGISGVIWGGRLRAVVHQDYVRQWPRACGITCYTVTTAPDPTLEERVVGLLGTYDGLFNIDYIGDHVLDVNPRVYGTIAMTAEHGPNLLDVLVRLVRGEEVGLDAPLRCRPGLAYRWLEGDLRCLAAEAGDGPDGRRQLWRSLLADRGTPASDWSRQDPVPTLCRLLHLARRAVSG